MGLSWLFGSATGPRAPVVVAFLVLLNALILRAADPPALARLRDIAFDNYQRIKPRERAEDMPVRIVDIDEAALGEYGQWPWPRTLVAKLVDKLVEKGAAVIAFDVVFAEADRLSIGRMVKDLPADDFTSELRRLAEKFPDNDEVLAEAMRRRRPSPASASISTARPSRRA